MKLQAQVEMFGESFDTVAQKIGLEKINLDLGSLLEALEIDKNTKTEIYRRNTENPSAYHRSAEDEYSFEGGYLIIKLPEEIQIQGEETDYITLSGPLSKEEAETELRYLKEVQPFSKHVATPVGIIQLDKADKADKDEEVEESEDRFYVAQAGSCVINFSDLECLTQSLDTKEKTKLLSSLSQQLLSEWANLAKNGLYQTEITPLQHVHTDSTWIYNHSSYGGGIVGPSCYSNAGLIADHEGVHCVLTGFKDMKNEDEIRQSIEHALHKGNAKQSRIGTTLTSAVMAITYQGMAMGIDFKQVSSIVETAFGKGLEVLLGNKKTFNLKNNAESEIRDYLDGEMIDAPPFVDLVEQFMNQGVYDEK